MSRYSTGNAGRARCGATGKVCLTRDEARRAAKTLNSKQQRDRDPVHDYRCPDCGRYHTGHARQSARSAVTLAQRRRQERRRG